MFFQNLTQNWSQIRHVRTVFFFCGPVEKPPPETTKRQPNGCENLVGDGIPTAWANSKGVFFPPSIGGGDHPQTSLEADVFFVAVACRCNWRWLIFQLLPKVRLWRRKMLCIRQVLEDIHLKMKDHEGFVSEGIFHPASWNCRTSVSCSSSMLLPGMFSKPESSVEDRRQALLSLSCGWWCWNARNCQTKGQPAFGT